MIITSVRVNIEMNRDIAKAKSQNAANLIAFASIVLDNKFVVTNIRIVKNNENKVIVSMPSRQTSYGEYKDVVYPTNREFRSEIEDKVLTQLRDMLVKKGTTLEIVVNGGNNANEENQ